jgi:SagB-type dehydrogenase family enzyme
MLVLSVSCEKTRDDRDLSQIPNQQLRTVLKGYAGDWRKDTGQARGVPAPPTETPLKPGAVRIPLPKRELLAYGDMPVRDSIASRRSRRTYSADPMTIEELAYLLWMTQGVTAYKEETGEVFRAAPSAGGRFPIDTYLSVHRVEGLKPGVYRYRSHNHELVLIRESPGISSEMVAACYGQETLGKAAVVFVWAAVPYRTEWKYSYLSHRMIAMEAGHICQNLYLASESIGAAACAMLSYQQPALDELIGVDGTDEFAIYMACVGKREGK